MSYTSMKTWTSETLTASDMLTYFTNNIEYLKGVTDGILFSGVQAHRATNQAISNATVTDVSFTSESLDYGGWFPATGTTITVPAGAIPSGYTTIAVNLNIRGRWASNGTGYRKFRFLINGTSTGSISVDANSGAETEVAMSDFAVVAAGDTIKADVYQNSGGALNLEICTLTVIRQAPVA